MPLYDVHAFRSVRVKFTGIEADTHKAAIAAVEADNDLNVENSRLVAYQGSGRITDIDLQEEPSTAFIVDVVGDSEFDESRSYDVGADGQPVEIGKEPGRGVPVNAFQRAALYDYADGDYRAMLDKAADQFELYRGLAQVDDLLPIFIAKELADAEDSEDAVSRMNEAASQIETATNAIATFKENGQ